MPISPKKKEKVLVGYNCKVCRGDNIREDDSSITHMFCDGVLEPVYTDEPQPKEDKKIEVTCECKEASCKNGCIRNHTHKTFSCESCEPQPSKGWEGKFVECDTCRAKPGSPDLCYGCLHNRLAIERINDLLTSERDRLVGEIRNRISNFLGSKYEGIDRISDFHEKGIMYLLSEDYDDSPKQDLDEVIKIIKK